MNSFEKSDTSIVLLLRATFFSLYGILSVAGHEFVMYVLHSLKRSG